MNVGKDYKDRLPTEGKIKKSLNRYFGFMHSKINTLTSKDFSKISKMQNRGWYLESSKEDIEELIDDFVNIYGYIYKNGNDSGHTRLIRGTTTDEVIRLREGNEIEFALSTSTQEEIAKRFCEYGKAALIRVKATEGLPCLYVEDLKDENVASEEEILILPFSKVKKVENISNWNGYKYYDLILEKSELPEISEERINELKQVCINGYDDFSRKLKEYEKLNNHYENICDRKDFSYEAKQQIYEEIKKIKEDITIYKNNLQELIKGLCRQREKDIEYQLYKEEQLRNEEYKKEQLEKENKLKQEIQKLKLTLEDSSKVIKTTIESNLEKVIRLNEWLKKSSKTLEIDMIDLQDIENSLIERVKKISEDLSKEIKEEDKNKEYKKVSEKILDYDDARILLGEMPKLIQNYEENLTIDLKNNLNEKVKEIIFELLSNNINSQKKKIMSEEDNFLDKVTRKSTLKEAKLNYLDAKMNYEIEKIKQSNQTNSVRKMLLDMYEYAYKYNGGILTDKMKKSEEEIRRVFGNLPDKNELTQFILKKQSKKLLSENKNDSFASLIKNNQEVKRLKEETLKLEEDTEKMKKTTIKNAKNNLNMSTKVTSIYSKFNNILDRVHSLVREDSNVQEVTLNQEYYQE